MAAVAVPTALRVGSAAEAEADVPLAEAAAAATGADTPLTPHAAATTITVADATCGASAARLAPLPELAGAELSRRCSCDTALSSADAADGAERRRLSRAAFRVYGAVEDATCHPAVMAEAGLAAAPERAETPGGHGPWPIDCRNATRANAPARMRVCREARRARMGEPDAVSQDALARCAPMPVGAEDAVEIDDRVADGPAAGTAEAAYADEADAPDTLNDAIAPGAPVVLSKPAAEAELISRAPPVAAPLAPTPVAAPATGPAAVPLPPPSDADAPAAAAAAA